MQTANGSRIFSASQDRSVRVRILFSSFSVNEIDCSSRCSFPGVASGPAQHLHPSPSSPPGSSPDVGGVQRPPFLGFRRQHRQSVGPVSQSELYCLGFHFYNCTLRMNWQTKGLKISKQIWRFSSKLLTHISKDVPRLLKKRKKLSPDFLKKYLYEEDHLRIKS